MVRPDLLLHYGVKQATVKDWSTSLIFLMMEKILKPNRITLDGGDVSTAKSAPAI